MNELGNISISSDVVATIAESVITEIDGIYSLAGNAPKNEITKFFQSVSSGVNKGIDVEVGETECTLDLYIIAKLGYQLPALAGEVQEVNVYIQKVVKDTNEENVPKISASVETATEDSEQ